MRGVHAGRFHRPNRSIILAHRSVSSEVPESHMPRKNRPRFLTTAEAAEFLRLKKHTLENMRSQESGPPPRKHGGRVFYHLDDLIAWSKSTRRKK